MKVIEILTDFYKDYIEDALISLGIIYVFFFIVAIFILTIRVLFY